jgi:hypothetical protein
MDSAQKCIEQNHGYKTERISVKIFIKLISELKELADILKKIMDS